MPKLKLNSLVEGMTGTFGDITIYQLNGKTVARRKREKAPPPSEKQRANVTRFKAAGVYARAAVADPRLKALYESAARAQLSAQNLAIRDFLKPPVIESLNLDAYTGQPGQLLRVKATDDFAVAAVHLAIRNVHGDRIEEGPAALDPETGEWLFRCRAAVPSGATVSVIATATDHPGNKAECQRWHHMAG